MIKKSPSCLLNMDLNYKHIGDCIHLVDERNTDLKYNKLVGLTVEKEFIPSVANVIGTDLSKYKIIRKHRFACSLMQVSRDGKMPVSMYDDKPAIMSPAYPMFELNDKNYLMPEYLHLYLSRSEFDREAVFYAVGGVRGSLDWNDFCEIKMNIPSIDEQRRIVSEYQTVERRIANNEALIQKLEETAQAIYHHTFVEGIDEEKLPEGWRVTDIEHFCIETKSGGTPSRTNEKYWSEREIPWLKSGEVQNCFVFDTEEYISKEGMACSSAKLIPEDSVVMAMYGATASQVCYLKKEMTTNQACCNMICDSKAKACFLYFHLKAIQSDIKKLANGGAQENLNKELVVSQRIISAPIDCYLPFMKIANYISAISEENTHLRTLLSLLTSKLS